MEKIEIGEYVRTDEEGIFKLTKLEIGDRIVCAYNKNIMYNFPKRTFEKFKHSKNIIDLIEIGDFVNGYKVIDFDLTFFNVVETLLKEYERVRVQTEHEINQIWEDKIKAKIVELDKKEKKELKGVKGQDRYFAKQLYQAKRNILQELLEGE